MGVIYLWYLPDLVDTASRERPLATWSQDRGFRWAPGEPRGETPFEREVMESLPFLLEQGCRFNQTGLASGNVREGRPFTDADIAPGIARLLSVAGATGQSWSWERHGQAWTLYIGRRPTTHGLNVLTVLDKTDAWDAHAAEVRDLIAYALNAITKDKP